MNVIGISYLEGFNCEPKFRRKVSKILSGMDDYTVVFSDDPSSLITQYFSEEQPQKILHRVDGLADANLTHAIFFDDGSISIPFSQKHPNVTCRKVAIKVTQVINLKKHPNRPALEASEQYEYIGRGSYWGNPHSMYETGEDREEVIRKFKYDFEHDLFPNKSRGEVHKLHGKTLGCFCSPAPCHGDVLAEYLNSYDDGQ